jgi:micrococcal nuclease
MKTSIIKKTSILITMFFMLLIFAGCQESLPNVVISKVFDATTNSNNTIELYNNSEERIDATNLSIRIYSNGQTTEGGDHQLNLTGFIEPNAFYVISGSNPNDSSISLKADVKHKENLPFNGNDVIELFYNNTLLDQFGLKGFDINFAPDLTMIRLGERVSYSPSKVYDPFNYIAYIPDAFTYLKNDTHEIKTLEDLYAGPKLEDRFLTMPYEDPDRTGIGFGGAVITVNTGIADGDTAFFSGMNGYPGGSLRYFYINTPEVDGGNVSAEPWGYVASRYNKEYLLKDANQKTIRIQSIPGNALKEGYGRNLGLVWINGALSQFLIVAEGLSEDVGSTYYAYDRILTYKDVPYLTFMRFAEARAVNNGWGVKGFPSNVDGEKSPDWNYQTNRNTTINPVWTPHLTLPWAS